jgi:glucose-6-phosphate 1-dehydrogenase
VSKGLADRPGTLVLLGATGDLAGRFLLPALARVLAAGGPDDLRVVGAAPQDGDDATFRSHVEARLATHATGVPSGVQQALLERLTYRRLDLADPAGVAEVLRSAGDDRTLVVYLALPPDLFSPALRALRAAGLPPGSRVAVEKPFGEDLAGAIVLNAQLAEVAGGGGGGGGGAAYRVDHVLGMPTARALLELRAPGAELAPLWDGEHLEQVDLLWEETLGLEGRADFFDRTGAVRDVVQNHLLQLLALVALELPTGTDGPDLHAATLALLRSVPPLSARQVPSRTRRGRYTAGRLVGTGTPVLDYAEEEGVDPMRGTETYAEIVLEVGTPRWRGTRFVLRAGKALVAPRKGVRLHPRPGVRLPGSGDGPLWIELDQPGGAGPGAGASGELLAYTAVLADVLSGGNALSVSAQEAEQTWQIVEPALRSWAAGAVPLLDYPAGSPGPPPLQGTVRR